MLLIIGSTWCPRGATRADPTRWRGFVCTTNTRGNGRLTRSCRQPVGDDLAALQHQGNARGVLQNGHVVERVAGDDDQIGELTLFDRADIPFEPKALRRPARRRPQCLKRRQPGFNETLDLHRVARVTVSAGIGSGGDRGAGSEGPPQALGMVLLQVMRALADMWESRFAVVFVDR